MRQITRFDDDTIPTYSAFSRLFKVLGPKATRSIHDRIVVKAREEKIAPGRKLRTNTTVVESDVHHPTDSSLLGDGIRVLTRHLGRIATECDAGTVKAVNHARAVEYRLLEINRAAKSLTEAGKKKLEAGHAKLVDLASEVTRQAAKVADRLLKWRASIESRIGTPKHRFDMLRAREKGAAGFEFHVGRSVIANNLVSLARGLVKCKRQEERRDKDDCWPGERGKTTGCYVPIAAQPAIRAGAAGRLDLQAALREPGAINRDAFIADARAAKAAAREARTGGSARAGRGGRQPATSGS